MHPVLKYETGTIIKEWDDKVSIALVYPNTYRTGMANLGLQALYGAFNESPYAVCERVFMPEAGRRQPLSLESSRRLKDFDLVAFSISSENDYINSLGIMKGAGLPLRSHNRGTDGPPVMAGGIAVTQNPVPLLPFFDSFFIGEGEEAASEIVDVLRRKRSQGKGRLLEALQEISGIFVPSLGSAGRVKRQWLKNIDRLPIRTIIRSPRAGLSGMQLVEISRGCRWKCRFCTASFSYLPPRERSLASLRPVLAVNGVRKTGLVSAMVSDHSEIHEIIRTLESLGQKVSVSSLRSSASSKGIIEALKRSGQKTVTIAPETGSERLRKTINKPLSDEEIMNAARMAFEAGIPTLKLYFMLGLPTETPEDIEAIAGLVEGIRNVFSFPRRITVALSPFVPKAWTPFQWAPYEGIASLKASARGLGKMLAELKGVEARTEGIVFSAVEAYLSRGDKGSADVLENSLVAGWKNIPLATMEDTFRERGQNETFPWEIIDTGVEKGFLLDEYHRALSGKVTPPCNVVRCSACGLC